MWALTGLMSLIRQEGYLPQDSALFHQLLNSLSMSLAHQANVAAAGASFTTLKRREFYAGHFLSSYPDGLKRAALSAPSAFAATLFSEEDLEALSSSSNQSTSNKTNQAILDYVSGHRSRSPYRSPRPSTSGYRRGRSPRSPNRTPKRVRFGTPPPSSRSPSPAKSPKTDFQK